MDKNQAEVLFKTLLKYQPEDKSQKKERLMKEAEARVAGQVQPFIFRELFHSFHLSTFKLMCWQQECVGSRSEVMSL